MLLLLLLLLLLLGSEDSEVSANDWWVVWMLGERNPSAYGPNPEE